MGLDVTTPRGQQTIADERAAVALFTAAHPDWVYVHTPKGRASKVDAVLMHHGEVAAIVETKCRYDVTLDGFRSEYGGEWLVTWDDKIDAARSLARMLCVPLVGWLYLVRDRVLLTVKITDDAGLLQPPIRLAATQTRATVNGGTAVRNNAFIDMSGARAYRAVT